MRPCEHKPDRWLDHLYGLLNEAECRELADHVAQCPSCQQALSEAQRDQRRMARAACLFRNVPEFEAPAGEQPRIVAPAALETPSVSATLPLRKPVRRSLAQRLWPIWVAAAALLLAIFSGVEWHRRGTADREQAVADAKKQREAIEGKFVELKLQADADQQALGQQAKRDALRLSVIGPGQIHADAPSAYRVSARDLDGRVLAAKLEISLVRADSGDVIHRQTVDAAGEVDVVIPAGLKLTKDLRLEIAAKHGTREAVVREPVEAAPTTHVAHLALNKSTYQLGEVVFFRALALERYSLRPPTQTMPLKVALVNAKGENVLNVGVTADPSGIVSGELALVSSLPAGNYTVQIAAADPKVQIQAQRRSLEIVEQLGDLDILPQSTTYHPGQKAVFNVSARAADGKPLAEHSVSAKTDIANEPGVRATLVRALTNALGRAVLQFPIPDNFQGSRVNVAFEMRRPNKAGKFELIKVERSIAVAPSQLEVDIYPEGGELIAGLQQRVFFRVRTLSGETAAPDGALTLHSSKGLIAESKPGQSLGSFTFTPDPKETYTLRLPTGSGISEIKNPFEKLGIKAQGVVLRVPESVAPEANKSVRLEVQQAGPARQLLAVASCRGQVIAHQLLGASATRTEINLPSGVRGAVRITLYEVNEQRLIPLAERLIYRTPAQRLDIKATATNFESKQTAQVKIETRDESNAAATAWALALVVDDHYRAESRERNLPGHFLLAGDIGGDVADTPLLADDTPVSREAIDLFLGTFGWRRFVAPAQAEPAQFAKGESAPRLFSSVSATDEQARAQAVAEAGRELRKLQERIDHERQQLEDQRQTSAATLAAALTARGDFARLPMEYLRLAMGMLAAAAFLAGAIGMTIGLVRAARRRAATPAFAGAMGALGLCLALYFSTGFFQGADDQRPAGLLVAEGKPLPRIEVALDKNLAITTAAPWDGQVALADAARPTTPSAPKYAMDLSRSVAMAGSTAMLDTSRSQFTKHPEMQKRFQAAEKMQQTQSQPSADFGREFAHRHTNDLTGLQPTLLWQPRLRIENGQATLNFDVPPAPASYRVLIYGHTTDGRLGFSESRIDVKAK